MSFSPHCASFPLQITTEYFHVIRGLLPYRAFLLSKLNFGPRVQLWGTCVRGQERKETRSAMKLWRFCVLTEVKCQVLHEITGNQLPITKAGSHAQTVGKPVTHMSQSRILFRWHTQKSDWSLLFTNTSCFAVQKWELIKILQVMYLRNVPPYHDCISIFFSMLVWCVCVWNVFKHCTQPLVAGCVWVCSQDLAEVVHTTYIN